MLNTLAALLVILLAFKLKSNKKTEKALIFSSNAQKILKNRHKEQKSNPYAKPNNFIRSPFSLNMFTRYFIPLLLFLFFAYTIFQWLSLPFYYYILCIISFVFLVALLAMYRKQKLLKQATNEVVWLIERITRGTRSGQSVNACLENFNSRTSRLLQNIVEQTAFLVTTGKSAGSSFMDQGVKYKIPELIILGTCLEIQSLKGGSISSTLDNIRTSIDNKKEIEDQIRSLSSEAMASAYIISALPIIFTAMIYVISPDYISVLFNDDTGKYLLGTAFALIAVGFLCIKMLIKYGIRQ